MPHTNENEHHIPSGREKKWSRKYIFFCSSETYCIMPAFGKLFVCSRLIFAFNVFRLFINVCCYTRGWGRDRGVQGGESVFTSIYFHSYPNVILGRSSADSTLIFVKEPYVTSIGLIIKSPRYVSDCAQQYNIFRYVWQF